MSERTSSSGWVQMVQDPYRKWPDTPIWGQGEAWDEEARRTVRETPIYADLWRWLPQDHPVYVREIERVATALGVRR